MCLASGCEKQIPQYKAGLVNPAIMKLPICWLVHKLGVFQIIKLYLSNHAASISIAVRKSVIIHHSVHQLWDIV